MPPKTQGRLPNQGGRRFVQSGMMFPMESDLQKRFEKMSAFEIITDLKAVFAP
jgi:hypothetical protein